MAKAKKSSVGAAIKRVKAEAAAKRAAAGTGNAALDKANAIKKGKAAKAAPKAKAAKPVKKAAPVKAAKKIAKPVTKKAAAPKAAPPVKAAKPQFFGRPKGAKKDVDPVKVQEQRNTQHAQLMQLDWYRDYRVNSIKLWGARRAAEAAGDDAEVEKINKQLDRIAEKRNKARAEWKAETGGKLPKAPKGGKAKKAPVTDAPAADDADVITQAEPSTGEPGIAADAPAAE